MTEWWTFSLVVGMFCQNITGFLLASLHIFTLMLWWMVLVESNDVWTVHLSDVKSTHSSLKQLGLFTRVNWLCEIMRHEADMAASVIFLAPLPSSMKFMVLWLQLNDCSCFGDIFVFLCGLDGRSLVFCFAAAASASAAVASAAAAAAPAPAAW